MNDIDVLNGYRIAVPKALSGKSTLFHSTIAPYFLKQGQLMEHTGSDSNAYLEILENVFEMKLEAISYRGRRMVLPRLS